MKTIGRILVAFAVATLPALAVAQAWPTKPVRFIVPYPPGGTSDILTRTIAEKLGPILPASAAAAPPARRWCSGW